jgi:hypothetical protein
MKTAILLLITLGFQSFSFANSISYTCRTADNSVAFSDDVFSALTENSVSKSAKLQTFITAQKTSTVWEFINNRMERDVWATFTATKVGPRKTIATGGGEDCNGGNKAGFETTAQHLSGTLHLGGKDRQIELLCTETLSYHGDCRN